MLQEEQLLEISYGILKEYITGGILLNQVEAKTMEKL